MHKDDTVKALITDSMVQKPLAKHLVLNCFRNSDSENLHAGIAPASKTGDYNSDVVHTGKFLGMISRDLTMWK